MREWSPAGILSPFPQLWWLKAMEKHAHRQLVTEPESLRLLPRPSPGSPLPRPPGFTSQGLGGGARLAPGSPGGGSGSGHSKRPRPSRLSVSWKQLASPGKAPPVKPLVSRRAW